MTLSIHTKPRPKARITRNLEATDIVSPEPTTGGTAISEGSGKAGTERGSSIRMSTSARSSRTSTSTRFLPALLRILGTTFTAGTGRSSEHAIPTSSICGRSFSGSAKVVLLKALKTTYIGFARSRRLAGQRPGFHTSPGGLPHSTSMRSQLAICTRRLRLSTDGNSLRSARNSKSPSSSIAMNQSRATTSTSWRHDIGPRDTSPEGSSSVCSP